MYTRSNGLAQGEQSSAMSTDIQQKTETDIQKQKQIYRNRNGYTVYICIHGVMDWSRESNRQQCQQATPTGPDVPQPIFWTKKSIFNIFFFFIGYCISIRSVQKLLQCQSKFFGKSGFGVLVQLNASEVNWIALE